MHLIVLHETAGSGNPLGISGNYERIPFSPYYLFKDLITIFIFIFGLSLFVFFMPNLLGDSENYVMANPMQTPPAIVPEWYLLPFYAILRSIPNKLLGVIAMFSAILALLLLPVTDVSRSRGMQFRPLSKIFFYIFIANFLILMQLGAKHVESPFIEFGQLSTILYFLYFAVIMYLATFIENTFSEIHFRSDLELTWQTPESLFPNLLKSDMLDIFPIFKSLIEARNIIDHTIFFTNRGIVEDLVSMKLDLNEIVARLQMNTNPEVMAKMLEFTNQFQSNSQVCANIRCTPGHFSTYANNKADLYFVAWQIQYVETNFLNYLSSNDATTIKEFASTVDKCVYDFKSSYGLRLECMKKINNFNDSNHSALMQEVHKILEKNPFGK